MQKYHIHLKASAFHQLIKKPLEDKNIFIALLPPTRVAEIVEYVCKYEDEISQNLLCVSHQKFVISLMTVLYIHVEKIFLKLKGIWYVLQKTYWNGLG